MNPRTLRELSRVLSPGGRRRHMGLSLAGLAVGAWVVAHPVVVILAVVGVAYLVGRRVGRFGGWHPRVIRAVGRWEGPGPDGPPEPRVVVNAGRLTWWCRSGFHRDCPGFLRRPGAVISRHPTRDEREDCACSCHTHPVLFG